MPALKNVRGSDLSFWMLKELKATPYHTFRIEPEIEIDYDDKGDPMPPEDCFSEELIKAVEKSRQDIKEGRCKKFSNADDLFQDLNED